MSSASSYVGKFMDGTTIHGFREIHHSKSTYRRLFWVTATVVGVAMTVWFVYSIVKGFQSRPILTTYTVISEPSMRLPKFQICLSNPIDARRVRELRLHKAIIEMVVGVGSISPLSTEQVVTQAISILQARQNRSTVKPKPRFNIFPLFARTTNEAWAVHQATASQFGLLTPESVERSFGELEDQLHRMYDGVDGGAAVVPDPFAVHFGRLAPFLKPTDSATPSLRIGELLRRISFTSEDVLTICKILNSDLTCQNISTTVEIQGGQQCYEINIVHNQTMGGFGLMALINTNVDNAYEGRSHGEDSVWIRLDKSDPASSFMLIKTPIGQSMKIILSAVHYYHSESKHLGTCVYDVPRFVLSTAYSDNICRADCLHAAALRACNCSLRVPANELVANTSYVECTSFEQLHCVAVRGKQFSADRVYRVCTKRCKPACDYWHYGTTVTYGRFPSLVLKRYLASLSKEDETLFDSHILLEYAFDTLQYAEVRQTPAMTLEGFVSQIGGQLSLFLGASILSLVHFVAWALHAAFRCACDAANAPADTADDVALHRRTAWSTRDERAAAAKENDRRRTVLSRAGTRGARRTSTHRGRRASSSHDPHQNGDATVANGDAVWQTADHFSQYYSPPILF